MLNRPKRREGKELSMSQLLMVLLLLGAAIAMFALGRPRTDAVAVLMLVALPFTGVISISEALAGFSDPNVVLIAALFVIGDALVRTGVAQRLGDWLSARAGASEVRLIALLMVVVAGIGAFMSSTGVVAIFIPIVLRIAGRTGIAPGRLMMPLSMAALISGMLTLVATAPNLVVQAELLRQGHSGFGFFSLSPFGLPILALAILYMVVMRRFLAPNPVEAAPQRPGLSEWVAEHDLAERGLRLRLRPGSTLTGRRLDALDLRASAGINIIAIASRRGAPLLRPEAGTVLLEGDVVLLNRAPRRDGGTFDPPDFAAKNGLELLPPGGAWFTDLAQDIGMAKALIPPGSRLIGQSLTEAGFRSQYDLSVLDIRRGPGPVGEDFAGKALLAGDVLLLTGGWRAIRRLREARRDLLLLDLPAEFDEVVPAVRRAPLAVAILLGVVGLMSSGLLPNVQAALLGCLLLGIAGCTTMSSAYRAIHWPSLILIVGMLPFALALQRTGGIDMAVAALLELTGTAGPRAVLALLFFATAVLGLFISNTATAVLMAPVAMALAGALEVSPYPLAMTVALAASAAFMTPVSSPVNTLVVAPGNYRFGDFVRIGVPFTLVTLMVSVLLVPILLPF